MQSIGYRHMLTCLNGVWDREVATAALIRDTRRYAKRQMTWFRHQQQVRWHQIDQTDGVFAVIDLFLQQCTTGASL
jgi:tRNA dimethylallyltransferase